jgi:methyl-accepting chemotaxis protein
MLLFGLSMGIVFPIYARFFVIWKEGMFLFFLAGCILAGITVGVVGFWFVKVVLIRRLNDISLIANDLKNNHIPDAIEIDSNDKVGVIITGLNSAIQSIRKLVEEMTKVIDI